VALLNIFVLQAVPRTLENKKSCESKDVLFRWRNRIEPGTADHIA